MLSLLGFRVRGLRAEGLGIEPPLSRNSRETLKYQARGRKLSRPPLAAILLKALPYNN